MSERPRNTRSNWLDAVVAALPEVRERASRLHHSHVVGDPPCESCAVVTDVLNLANAVEAFVQERDRVADGIACHFTLGKFTRRRLS